jgi:hypothetical protein
MNGMLTEANQFICRRIRSQTVSSVAGKKLGPKMMFARKQMLIKPDQLGIPSALGRPPWSGCLTASTARRGRKEQRQGPFFTQRNGAKATRNASGDLYCWGADYPCSDNEITGRTGREGSGVEEPNCGPATDPSKSSGGIWFRYEGLSAVPTTSMVIVCGQGL